MEVAAVIAVFSCGERDTTALRLIGPADSPVPAESSLENSPGAEDAATATPCRSDTGVCTVADPCVGPMQQQTTWPACREIASSFSTLTCDHLTTMSITTCTADLDRALSSLQFFAEVPWSEVDLAWSEFAICLRAQAGCSSGSELASYSQFLQDMIDRIPNPQLFPVCKQGQYDDCYARMIDAWHLDMGVCQLLADGFAVEAARSDTDPRLHTTVWSCILGAIYRRVVRANDCGKAATCSADTTCCNQECVQTTLDDQNCGACGATCDALKCERCGLNIATQTPECISTCQAGESCCDEMCIGAIDKIGSSTSCGACGIQCREGDNPLCCDGQCLDGATDNDNCGGCGVRCPDGRACSAGECVCATALCPFFAEQGLGMACCTTSQHCCSTRGYGCCAAGYDI
jgi:hypothetical protein